MDRSDVEIIEKTTPFQGYFRIDRYRLRHRLFAGGWTGEVVREIFERGHAVGLLPYDPARDELVLIEQFRPGAYAAPGFRPWLVEIVAGIIEPGEEPEEVARRETHEEAGCELHAMRPIFDYIASPGGTTHSVKLYLGRVDSSKAQGIHGLSDEHEDIRVLVVPFADWPALQQEGRISDACSLLALQWLALNRDEVRATWTP